MKKHIPLTPYKNENAIEQWLDQIIKRKAQAPREDLIKEIDRLQAKLNEIKETLQRCI